MRKEFMKDHEAIDTKGEVAFFLGGIFAIWSFYLWFNSELIYFIFVNIMVIICISWGGDQGSMYDTNPLIRFRWG